MAGRVVLQDIKEVGKMELNDIEKLIQMIPEYIEYVYPGFLLMYLFQFFKGRSTMVTKETIMVAICMSYVMKLLFHSSDRTATANNILMIVCALVIAYIAYRITESDKTVSALRWLKIYTTFDENEIDVLVGESNAAWLCVYLKDENLVYEGSLGPKEMEKGEERFITLEAYYKYRLNEQGNPIEPYIEDHDGDYEEKVVIRFDDIKRIEKRSVDKEEQ